MATETRVVSEKKKIGAKSGPSGDTSVQEVPAKKGKKKLIVILLVVVLVAAGAGYWFVLKPKASAGDGAAATASAEPEPVPGTVLVIDSISINLAGGHYLRLGLALQLTADVHEDPDTARALDLAIALFSQQPLEQVSDEANREALKAELLAQLKEAYHGEVMDVYFTDFVTQ